MTKIVAIPAFQDNYIWAMHSLDGSELIVVDPGTADPVFAYLQKNKMNLTTILLTHHHWDHSGGIPALKEHFPEAKVFGPKNDNVATLTDPLTENDIVSLINAGITLKVLDIPGHTLGHIAFYNNEMLFCGDTLFSCGCGGIFEGTPEQMYQSLEKIKKLAANTLMYCGHEYTLANIAFAQMVEPHHQALGQRKTQCEALRAQNLPTLPVALESEFLCNPFLRCSEATIIDAVQKQYDIKTTDPVTVFAKLRDWKNHFKA